jgi:hypothetical protein
MSLLLGSATPGEANLTDAQPSTSATLRVSEHLGAIREAVSVIAPTMTGATRLSWNNNPWGNRFHNYVPPKPLPKKDPHPFHPEPH